MNASTFDLLLLELEEELSVEGLLALYQISWSLAGLGVERSDPTFEELARRAYTEFRAKHPELVLASGTWPDLLGTASRADGESDVALDLDPATPPGTPMLLLVHPRDLPPS